MKIQFIQIIQNNTKYGGRLMTIGTVSYTSGLIQGNCETECGNQAVKLLGSAINVSGHS